MHQISAPVPLASPILPPRFLWQQRYGPTATPCATSIATAPFAAPTFITEGQTATPLALAAAFAATASVSPH